MLLLQTEWEKRTGMSVQPSSSAGPSETQAIGDGRALADQTRELEEKVASKRKEVSRLLSELQPIRQKHKTQLDIISKENQRQNAQDLQTVRLFLTFTVLCINMLEVMTNFMYRRMSVKFAKRLRHLIIRS